MMTGRCAAMNRVGELSEEKTFGGRRRARPANEEVNGVTERQGMNVGGKERGSAMSSRGCVWAVCAAGNRHEVHDVSDMRYTIAQQNSEE